MASEVDICNRALQKLGAKRIQLLTQDAANARACNANYASLRDAELQAHPWNFATKRQTLPAVIPAPTFGFANAFALPADFLAPLPPDPRYNCYRDWEIEGGLILTDEAAPLYLRYTARITDPTLFVPLFVEALACRIALELCEEITQSNTKKASLSEDYKLAVREARHKNAVAKPPVEAVEDTWLTARRW